MSRIILAPNDYQDFDTTSASASVTLDEVIGKQYVISNTGTGGNTLTVNYGANVIELEDEQTFSFIYNGTQWSSLSGSGGGGATSVGVLGEGVSIGDLLYFASDGLLYLADNTDPIKSVVAGVCLKTGTTGAKVVVQKSGLLDLFTGLTVGEDYYLGTAGAIVLASALADCDKKVFVGRAVSTTAIDVNVQLPESDKTTITDTLGESVTAGNSLYYGSDGKLYVASNNTIATSIVVGVALASGVLDDEICYRKIGAVSAYTGLTAGSTYYLGNTGNPILRTAIADGEQVVQLGVAVSATELILSIQPPERTQYTDKSIGQFGISAVSGDSWLLSHGFIQFDFDNAVSQSVYAALFAKIGHMYNAQHVEAGDADLSGSSTLFYPTPVPGKYGRVGIPDLSIDGTSLALPSGFRDGTKFIVKSGTDQVAGTVLYIRRVDASNVTYHSTEDGAINNTDVLTVTGVGVLTQEGIAIDDAMQRITGQIRTSRLGSDLTVVKSGVFDSSASSVSNASDLDNTESAIELLFDNADSTSPNPAKTSDNETRGTTFYEFWYIKAESVLPSTGEVASASLDVVEITGITDLTNATIPVPHKLNAYSKDMIIKLEARCTSLSLGWQEVLTIGAYTTTSVQDYGAKIDSENSTLSSFDIITAAAGIRLLDDLGDWRLITVNSVDFRITLIKPNLVATYNYAPDIVEITDAVDVVKGLPSPTEISGEYTIGRRGSGSGTMTFNAPAGVDIRWFSNNAITSSIEFEGDGVATIESVGGELYVTSYEDSVLGNYAFNVGLTANSDPGTGNPFLWDDITLNNGNCYDALTGRYTVKKKGLYSFALTPLTTSAARIAIYKNGTAYQTILTGSAYSSALTTVLELDVDDYIDVRPPIAAETMQDELSHFSGYLIK